MTKKHKYTEEQLQNAINEYKLTGLLRQTARSFKIPVMTLHDRVSGKTRLIKTNRGAFCSCASYNGGMGFWS